MTDHVDDDPRSDELSSIAAIFPELKWTPQSPEKAFLELSLAELEAPIQIKFCDTSSGGGLASSSDIKSADDPRSANDGQCTIDTHQISFLPPLYVDIRLPSGYPYDEPPTVSLKSEFSWIPLEKLEELQREAGRLWVDYGHDSIIFAFIDTLQQAAENVFDLSEPKVTPETILCLPRALQNPIIHYDTAAKRRKFESGVFPCGVCLSPKRGIDCYRFQRCGHVFCIECLQDFFGSCITEGDVDRIQCVEVGCAKRKKSHTLSPAELMRIPLDVDLVNRYVEMKRKKRLESDKSTVWCPRKWCQGAARSKRHPKLARDATGAPIITNLDSDSESDLGVEATKEIEPGVDDRIAVCEDCTYAFCRVCRRGWHGELFYCKPASDKVKDELERLSLDYVRLHTSPCPQCGSPVQKTEGCNHMVCYQCRCHFCYLCSSWLRPDNPYQHFNNRDDPCYYRLFDFSDGDPGTDGDFVGPRAWERDAIELEARERAAQAEAG